MFTIHDSIINDLTQVVRKLPFLVMRGVGSTQGRFLTIRSGILRNVKWSLDVNDLDYLIGTYESAGINTLLQNLRTGNTFYDIGANVGYYSVIASMIISKKGIVFSFEPLPENIHLLREHLRINKIENVYPFEYAVSNRSGSIGFSNSRNLAANTYISASDIYNNESAMMVKSVTIDEFVESNSAPLPDFIKIDVEGAELDVLEGALVTIQASYPHILLATHDRTVPGVKDRCLHYLRELGYRVKPLREMKILPGQEDYFASHPNRIVVG